MLKIEKKKVEVQKDGERRCLESVRNLSMHGDVIRWLMVDSLIRKDQDLEMNPLLNWQPMQFNKIILSLPGDQLGCSTLHILKSFEEASIFASQQTITVIKSWGD